MAKKRVLAASHERHIARLVQLNLERQGYDVEVAYDSASCWEKVCEAKPDLFVLDLSMPNAIQLLERLKADERTKAIPTITLEHRISLTKDSFSDLRLPRPSSPDELMRMIAEKLEGKHVPIEPTALPQKLAPLLLAVIFWAFLMAVAALALIVWLHR